jgi:hypothetical protein
LTVRGDITKTISVPEPGTLALFTLALPGIGFAKKMNFDTERGV